MKTFVAMFGVSMAFGLAIAILYWFVAHAEPAGIALLGIMTAALAFAAGYALLAERDAKLDGDRESVANSDVAGEDLGVFSSGSIWPIFVALSVVAVLVGIVCAPSLAAAGLLALLYCFWRLGAESSIT